MRQNLETTSQSNEAGFTLIELLVAISIVGILSAIAISTYIGMRVRAFNVMAKSDFHAAITAEEAYYAQHQTYVSCNTTAQCEGVLPGFSSSGPQVSISFTVPTPDALTGTASHLIGDVTYEYDNAVGLITEQ